MSPYLFLAPLTAPAKVGGSLAVSLAFNVVNAKGRKSVSSGAGGGATSGPRAVKRPHPVPFGKVGEENRGKVNCFVLRPEGVEGCPGNDSPLFFMAVSS